MCIVHIINNLLLQFSACFRRKHILNNEKLLDKKLGGVYSAYLLNIFGMNID